MAFGKLSVDELISSNNISVTGNVSFTGNVTVGAGTASNAAISTTGDPNTGIFFPAADNIGFATNGVIRGRWTTDGLCFGSDTAAANALDDYEEGTWSPTMRGSTTAGTTTYSAQEGWYTKIGNTVHVGGYVVWSAATGTGNLQIGNLPFTTNATYYSHIAIGTSNITVTASNYVSLMETVLNDTRFNLYQTPTGGGVLAAVPIDTAGSVFFGGVYNI
jgi:hypothetical protein